MFLKYKINSFDFGFFFVLKNGSARWNALDSPDAELYPWDSKSTYIKSPPFFETMVRFGLILVELSAIFVQYILQPKYSMCEVIFDLCMQ